MRISYNKLWKMLIDKEMNKNDLKEKIVINSDEFKNYMNNKDCFLQVFQDMAQYY